jgi:hypothetical protein
MERLSAIAWIPSHGSVCACNRRVHGHRGDRVGSRVSARTWLWKRTSSSFGMASSQLMSEVREFVDRTSRRRKLDSTTFSFGVVPVESFFVIKVHFPRDRGFVCLNSECFCEKWCYSFSHQRDVILSNSEFWRQIYEEVTREFWVSLEKVMLLHFATFCIYATIL